MNKLLGKLISNVLNINVYIAKAKDADLKQFVNEHNGNNFSIQFEKEYLNSFIKTMDSNTFYEIADNLNERIFVFKYNKEVFVLGPYLKRFINEMEVIKIGTYNNIPSNRMESLKIQYFHLPIFDTFHIENTINNIIVSIDEDYKQYKYTKINYFKSKRESEYKSIDLENDLLEKDIYSKYEAENNLLYQVEHGQVEEIKLSMKKMTSVAREDYLISFHASNPQAAMASYRTLLRKAAERSSLPITIIDRIISKYTQLMLSSSPNEQVNYLRALSIELTTEVRKYLIKVKYQSSLIKNICEYLYVHYSEDISLDGLSKKYNASQYYLIHLFKKETGKTIHEFLESIRIMRAEEMLKDNYLTISEIANLVGYPDNNYFTKVFKKSYQMTPSQYRLSSHK